MNRRRFTVTAAALVAAPRVASATESGMQVSASGRTAIEHAASRAMAAAGTRGVSVTVASEGAIVYARGFGERDIAEQLAVDAATIFPIGSITKQFTAAGVMLLARDGKVALDAKASAYVPSAPHADAYTVRELLQQTTGLPNYTAAPAFLTKVATSTTVTPQVLLDLVRAEPFAFTPGTRWEYSNTNYVVLGMLIERVAGIPYGTFIAERIAKPLRLAHLSYGPPTGGANLALGYEHETGTKPIVPWTTNATYAAGGLYAAPDDLVRWDEAFFGGALLDRATVTLMTTPPQLPGGANDDYGFGWIRSAIDSHTMIWHNGGVLGANSRNAYFPDERIAIVVFGNSIAFDETEIVREAFRALVPPTAAQLAAEREAKTTPAPGEDSAITAQVKAEYERWRTGKLDFDRYAAVARGAFSPSTVAQVSANLTALGAPTAFVFKGKDTIQGMTRYVYRVVTPNATITYLYVLDGDGKITGIFFTPAP